MSWYTEEVGFCESVISGPPEYANAISSVILLFYGLCGIFASRNTNIILRMTSALLATTGFGSIAYHATLQTGWGYIDSLPMLMASYLGAYVCFDIIVYKKLGIEQNRRKYEIVSGMLAYVLMICLCFSVAMSVVSETKYLFSIFFLIPELMIAVAVVLIRYVSHNDVYNEQFQTTDEVVILPKTCDDLYIVNKYQLKKAFQIMWIGMGTAASAAIFWFATELECHKEGKEWIRFLYAHVIWHCGIGMGMYYLMQFLVFLHAYNNKHNPYFISSDNKYWKLFYILVPCVDMERPSIRSVII